MNDIHPAFREALAYHWIISTGFKIPLDDIFVGYDTSMRRFHVVVRHNGNEFDIGIADLDFSKEEFVQRWSETVRVYNAASAEEKTVMIESTKARENAVDLVAAMVAKGFKTTAEAIKVTK